MADLLVLLATAFLMLKPFANLIEKPINLMENIHRNEFLDDYLHMETWINDNIPVPGEDWLVQRTD